MYILHRITVSFIVLFVSVNVLLGQQFDRFAQIGNKIPAIRTHLLHTPQAPILDTMYLTLEKGRKHAFVPIDKMDTKEELNAELDKMRLNYAPFMQDFAPAIQNTRFKINLNTFKWKEETEHDKQNFAALLNGEGNWSEVAIPHFGEPLGEACTYYFKSFELTPEILEKEALFIHFNGVDYKADVFINGYYLGSHEGFFAPFEFDFTKLAKKGTNNLLVKVTNHEVGAKGEKIYAATGPGYDDPTLGWHHCPAGMGIYQDVFIEARSDLHINDLFVRPLAENDSAEIWLEINNTRHENANIQIEYSVYGQNFKDTICTDVSYRPATIKVAGLGDMAKSSDGKFMHLSMQYGSNFLKIPITIPNAKLWSNEGPWLYQLQVKIINEFGNTTDEAKKQFGMRSFSMDATSIPKGKLFLNNSPVRLRGANTMGHLQRCVMDKNWEQLRDDILLAKIANMNFLRLTQRPVQPEIYEYCDRLGMMTQTDLPLFGFLRRTKFAEAIKQAEEMERLIRSHPCNIMVSFINERFPNANGFPHRCFSDYADYEKFYTAASQSVLIANPDRVIKPGDGDYDPPSPGLPDSHCYNMWYNGHGLGVGEFHKGFWQPIKPGWYYGCGEYGSEGLDPVNIMEKYYPKEWIEESKEGFWKPNNIQKCQTPAFHIMWYDAQKTKHDWVEISQNHQALATKWMTEAFRRDSRNVSSAIHLFIDAWPAGWMKSIMDVERQPKKAYFAYRDALSPFMVSLRSDCNKYTSGDHVAIETWICNDKNEQGRGYKLNYQVENENEILYSGEQIIEVPVNSSDFAGFINWLAPKVTKRTSYKIRCVLQDEYKRILHENELEVEVFPPIKTTPIKAFVLADRNGVVPQIIKKFALVNETKLEDASVILMDGKCYSDSVISDVLPWVLNGTKLVIFNLPIGNYSMANSMLNVVPTNMGHYYFVSSKTNHKFLKEFKPDDFKFWFDEEKKCIAPILSSMISVENWNPILKTGIGKRVNNLGSVDFMDAATEKAFGKGSIIISQLELKNKLNDNPTAIKYLKEILE